MPLGKVDVYAGLRDGQMQFISGQHLSEGERRESVMEIAEDRKKGPAGIVRSVVGAFI